MKRSEINKALKELEAMCAQEHCYLPPFCHFTPEAWESKGHEYDEVRDCMLGWDITDYGQGDFDHFGFSLITIRNGNRAMPDKYPKVYAEKLLYLREGQYAPNHFHWFKTEDIINRGGGNVLIRVYNRLPNEEIDYESDVEVHTDGKSYTVPAGTQIRLKPGESIFVYQGLYHDFSVEPGTGPVLLGEVSQCNDDNTDNRFNPPVGRFPKIEEDETDADAAKSKPDAVRRSVRRADDGAWLQTRNTISLERRQTILAGPRAGAVSVCCAPDRWLLYALRRTLFNGHSRICKGFCFHYRRAVFRFCYVLSAADTGNAAAVSVPLYIPGTLCAARLDGPCDVFRLQ